MPKLRTLKIPKSIASILERRKEPLFTINPTTSALLVVDMQRDFLVKGAPLWQSHYEKIVPNVAKLIEFCREKKISVIWVAEVRSPHGHDAGLMDMMWPRKGQKGHLIRGSDGAKIYEGLPRPLDSEVLIEKHRYSAFYQTDLELHLRNMGIDTLFITGLNSNICCQTTARDGFMRDFKIVMVSDGTAAQPAELHEPGLLEILVAFGRVLSSDEVIQEVKSQLR